MAEKAGGKLRNLLEMIRFSHTVFALPFALLAAVMAWTAPSDSEATTGFDWIHLPGILLCMVGARTAAMTFNRIADRKIDARNPRTAGRHLPTGKVGTGEAWMFLLAALALFFVGTICFVPNWLPLAISPAVLCVLFGYSYAKRFTSLSQFWLGTALMLAPICVWLAIRGEVVAKQAGDLMPAALLGLAVMFWVAGFDSIYACQDVDFDRKAHLKSVPVWLGVAGALRLALVCHLMMVLLLAAIPFSESLGGPAVKLGWLYWLTLAGIVVLLAWEHSLVRANDLTRVNQAFFNANAIVSFSLFVLGTVDLLFIR